jgi:hypothetical protein
LYLPHAPQLASCNTTSGKTLPRELTRLSEKLTALAITSSRITGPVPDFLYLMASLRVLDLSGAFERGEAS